MLTDEVLTVFVLPLEFGCTILNDNRLLTNVYHIKLGIDPLDSVADNIGIGFQRIKYLTEYHLEDSIFLEKDTELAKYLSTLDNNLVSLPCNTYDIYIGAVLLAKFQAITAKYFDIQYLSIASEVGDNVQFNIIDPEDINLNLDGDYWWNQDNVYTGSKNIVTWEELNLTEIPKFKPTVVKGGLCEN